MTFEQYTQYAQQVADEVGVELIDTYEDGEQELTYVEDDGILHAKTRGFRAAFDVSENQTLKPATERINIKYIKKAFNASVWA